MASLFKIKEEEDEDQTHTFSNNPSDLPSIEDFNDESDKLMNHSDTDSSTDEKPEGTHFNNLDLDATRAGHERQNSESETTPFEMFDNNFPVKFDEEPGTSSQNSSEVKSKSLKRRKSEEARQEAKNKKEMEEEEREKMQ